MARTTNTGLRPDISEAGDILVTGRYAIQATQNPTTGVIAVTSVLGIGRGEVSTITGATPRWNVHPSTRIPPGSGAVVTYGLELVVGVSGTSFYPVGTATAPLKPDWAFVDFSLSVQYEATYRTKEQISNGAGGIGKLILGEIADDATTPVERLLFQGVQVYSSAFPVDPYSPVGPSCTATCIGNFRTTDAGGGIIHIACGKEQIASAAIQKLYRGNPDFPVQSNTVGEVGWGYAKVNAPALERIHTANFFRQTTDVGDVGRSYWTQRGVLTVEVVADRMTDPDTGTADIEVTLNEGELVETFPAASLPWQHTWTYSVGTQRLRGQFFDGRSANFPASYAPVTTVVAVDRGAADITAPTASVTVDGRQTLQLSQRIAPRDVLSIEQAAETYIDGPTWATGGIGIVSGWAGYGGDPAIPTVVGGGSAMRLTAAVIGTGSFAHKEHATPLGVGYRHYELRCRSIGADNVNFNLWFGGWYDTGGLGELPDTAFEAQKWSITTGDDGEWVEVPLDLFVGENDYEVQAAAPDQWLGARVARTVIRIPTGSVIEIAWFRGVRKHETLASVLLPFVTFGLGGFHTFTDGLPAVVYPISFADAAVTMAALISTINDGRPKSGFTATDLFPAASNHYLDTSQPIAFLEGGGFWHRSRPGTSGPLPLDMDLTGGPLTLQACGAGITVATYPCAGDVEAPSSGTTATVLMRFRTNTGTRVNASLQGPGKDTTQVVFTNTTLSAPAGTGPPRASGSGLAITGTPYGRPPAFPATEDFRVETVPAATQAVETGLYATVGSALEFPLSGGNRGQILWARFKVPSAGEPIPLAIDSARGWYYIGHEEKISTRRVRDNGLVQTSADLGHVWTWLEYDERAAVLLALTVEDGEALLFVSRDGGISIGTEVVTVDANSAAIAVVSAPNVWVLLYEDPADDLLKRRASGDGGVTWSTAAAVLVDGATVEAEVKSMEYDARAASILLGVIKTATEAKVIRSRDQGVNWESFAL